jgi:hypothetical protein
MGPDRLSSAAFGGSFYFRGVARLSRGCQVLAVALTVEEPKSGFLNSLEAGGRVFPNSRLDFSSFTEVFSPMDLDTFEFLRDTPTA